MFGEPIIITAASVVACLALAMEVVAFFTVMVHAVIALVTYRRLSGIDISLQIRTGIAMVVLAGLTVLLCGFVSPPGVEKVGFVCWSVLFGTVSFGAIVVSIQESNRMAKAYEDLNGA